MAGKSQKLGIFELFVQYSIGTHGWKLEVKKLEIFKLFVHYNIS